MSALLQLVQRRRAEIAEQRDEPRFYEVVSDSREDAEKLIAEALETGIVRPHDNAIVNLIIDAPNQSADAWKHQRINWLRCAWHDKPWYGTEYGFAKSAEPPPPVDERAIKLAALRRELAELEARKRSETGP